MWNVSKGVAWTYKRTSPDPILCGIRHVACGMWQLRLCMVIYVRHLNGSAVGARTPAGQPTNCLNKHLAIAQEREREREGAVGESKRKRERDGGQSSFSAAGFSLRSVSYHGQVLCLPLINYLQPPFASPTSSCYSSAAASASSCFSRNFPGKRHFTCLAIMSKVFGYLSI